MCMSIVGIAVAACGSGVQVSTNTGGTSASAGVLALSAASYSVKQSAGTAVVSVNRANGSAGAVSIGYATSDGTAVAGSDYTAAAGSIDWADGDTASKTFSIPISTALSWSGTKSFNVTLSSPSGGAAEGTPSGGTVDIAGSGSGGGATPGTLALSSATYTVAQGAGSAVISVNRSAGSSGAVAINFTTANGTAAAGSDYTATSGTLQWAANDATAKTFAVPISNAAPFSGAKTFTVGLSSPTGGSTLGTPSTATVTVNGSMAGAPGTLALSAATYTVAQNAGALVITVGRTAGVSGAVGVTYATTDGTAAAGTDYTAATGTLNWAANDASAKTFSVPISNTAPFTGSKTFMVALSSPTGGASVGSPSSATATINGGGAAANPGTIALSGSAKGKNKIKKIQQNLAHNP